MYYYCCLPVVCTHLQYKQPLVSMVTHERLHPVASNGGHPPAFCPLLGGPCVAPVGRTAMNKGVFGVKTKTPRR